MPRFSLPWPVAAPLILLAGIAVADRIHATAKPLASPVVHNAVQPISLPRAEPAPTDPVEFDLYHAARMVRRAENAAAIGQTDIAAEWLSQARDAAGRVVHGASTPAQRDRAIALDRTAQSDLLRFGPAPLPQDDIVTAK